VPHYWYTVEGLITKTKLFSAYETLQKVLYKNDYYYVIVLSLNNEQINVSYVEADRVEIHVFKLYISMIFSGFSTASQKQTVTHFPTKKKQNNHSNKTASLSSSSYCKAKITL